MGFRIVVFGFIKLGNECRPIRLKETLNLKRTFHLNFITIFLNKETENRQH